MRNHRASPSSRQNNAGNTSITQLNKQCGSINSRLGLGCDVIDKVWEGKLERVEVGNWLWFWVRGVGGGTGFNGFNIEGHEGEVVVRGWERNWRKEEAM
ncbi:hypothetical protein TrLO_g3887 [Triparma laevis f. longispina]|uniref:Uncharacterized protein n=1 Tax=Triparma laevis f. longispina TaxID=1714387 RepID=A0A9W7ALR6_9STRA|nr:hypothetical protein TrLO_g3887 [Triparma laevis f. longispina]